MFSCFSDPPLPSLGWKAGKRENVPMWDVFVFASYPAHPSHCTRVRLLSTLPLWQTQQTRPMMGRVFRVCQLFTPLLQPLHPLHCTTTRKTCPGHLGTFFELGYLPPHPSDKHDNAAIKDERVFMFASFSPHACGHPAPSTALEHKNTQRVACFQVLEDVG